MESCSACTHSLSLPLKHNKLHTNPLYGVFHVTWIWYQSRECFPLSISIQPLLLLTKERQEHEKYLEYTHTHNRRLLPLKIYSSRPIWKKQFDATDIFAWSYPSLNLMRDKYISSVSKAVFEFIRTITLLIKFIKDLELSKSETHSICKNSLRSDLLFCKPNV